MSSTLDKTLIRRVLSDKTILSFKINVYAKLFKWTKNIGISKFEFSITAQDGSSEGNSLYDRVMTHPSVNLCIFDHYIFI